MTLLEKLAIRLPIILAPMAGGPGTPELAAAVTNAGGLGSLGVAYLTPDQIREEIRRTRALTPGPINVNAFAGGVEPMTRDPAPALLLMSEIHAELALPAPALPPLPPNPFERQIEVAIESRVPVFSFTFGIPPPEAMAWLRASKIVTIGTATTVEEARMLEEAGVDAVVAQGAEAGAHRGTFTVRAEEALSPTMSLVRDVVAHVKVPVIASGGIMTGAEIADALRAGAEAVQLGTAFLACPEAGTSRAYREALLGATGDPTVITRAFSGRAARGIRNAFIDRVGEREELILPFPLQNALTRPMRTAAAQRGNADYLSLWAGRGVARIRSMPAGDLVALLAEEIRQNVE